MELQHNHQNLCQIKFWASHENHGSRRSVQSVARSVVDRVDRFGRFGNFAVFFEFFAMSGSSRSVWCPSFSSVRRLEAEKMPKNRNANLSFSVRSVRYPVRFDRYCVRGSLVDCSENFSKKCWVQILPNFWSSLF